MIAQLVYDYKNLLGVWWKCTVQLFGWRSANIPGGLTIIATQDGFRACPLQLWECKGSKPGGLPEVDGLMGHTIINTHQHDTMFFERYRYLLPKHGNKYVKKKPDPYQATGRSIPLSWAWSPKYPWQTVQHRKGMKRYWKRCSDFSVQRIWKL